MEVAPTEPQSVAPTNGESHEEIVAATDVGAELASAQVPGLYEPPAYPRSSLMDLVLAEDLAALEEHTIDGSEYQSNSAELGTIVPSSAFIASIQREESFSTELSEWLRASSSSTELARTVQQIEQDIRSAIDSAAARVNEDLHRKEQLEQTIRHITTNAPSEARSPGDFSQLGELQTPIQHVSAPSTTVETVTGANEISAAAAPVVTDNTELLMIMEVLIGDGRSASIEIHTHDDPLVLAQEFAATHGLPFESIPKLAQHIRDQLAALDETETPENNVNAQPTSDQDGLELEEIEEYAELEEWRGIPELPLEPPTTIQSVHHQHATVTPSAAQLEWERRQKETYREFSYNSLMEKYGHYAQHSGKVNPHGASRSHAIEHHDRRHAFDDEEERATLASGKTMRMQAGKALGGSKKTAKPVFQRLYALAETKEKWRQRAVKAKKAEEDREFQEIGTVEMAAKSKALIAHRNNGSYAHIGERLYEEALSDMAKKEKRCQQRAEEKEANVNWMCPKCAFMNRHEDDHCKNPVATAPTNGLPTSKPSTSPSNIDGTGRNLVRRESHGTFADGMEVVCGHRKPARLFQPTLLAGASSVMKSIQQNKENAVKTASDRRHRNQVAMEELFQKICPFRPTINKLSAEIVREKQENGTARGGNDSPSSVGHGRKKPVHNVLYEEAFQIKASRDAKEEAYLKQFSFKPNIGVNSLWLSGDRSAEDFVQRLAVTKYQELERKREELNEKYDPARDPDTGREFFKPETGRAPIFNRNERNLPIGDFLFESHREQQEYHRRLRQEDEENIKRQAEQRYLSRESKQALEARKKRTFDRIFDALLKTMPAVPQEEGRSPTAKDANAMLEPINVQLEKLPAEIKRIAAIVFEFANHRSISKTAFSEYMTRLLEEVPGLTYTQVLFLTTHLDDGKQSRTGNNQDRTEHDDENCTFHPTIDKNSVQMAAKHGRIDRSKVFLALNQYYEHYKQRTEQTRKQQERDFERDHPFQPKLVAKQTERHAAKFYSKIQQRNGKTQDTSGQSRLTTAATNPRPCVRPMEAPASGSSPVKVRARSPVERNRVDSTEFDEDDVQLTQTLLEVLETKSTKARASAVMANAGDASSKDDSDIASDSALLRPLSLDELRVASPTSLADLAQMS